MWKVEDFNIGPLRRIRHPLNQQKVRIWRWSGRKNKNYYDRTQYVYENKQNDDKMTGTFADICAQLRPLLQKIAGLEPQFTAIFGFRTPPCGYLRRQAACRHLPVQVALPDTGSPARVRLKESITPGCRVPVRRKVKTENPVKLAVCYNSCRLEELTCTSACKRIGKSRGYGPWGKCRGAPFSRRCRGGRDA